MPSSNGLHRHGHWHWQYRSIQEREAQCNWHFQGPPVSLFKLACSTCSCGGMQRRWCSKIEPLQWKTWTSSPSKYVRPNTHTNSHSVLDSSKHSSNNIKTPSSRARSKHTSNKQHTSNCTSNWIVFHAIILIPPGTNKWSNHTSKPRISRRSKYYSYVMVQFCTDLYKKANVQKILLLFLRNIETWRNNDGGWVMPLYLVPK